MMKMIINDSALHLILLLLKMMTPLALIKKSGKSKHVYDTREASSSDDDKPSRSGSSKKKAGSPSSSSSAKKPSKRTSTTVSASDLKKLEAKREEVKKPEPKEEPKKVEIKEAPKKVDVESEQPKQQKSKKNGDDEGSDYTSETESEEESEEEFYDDESDYSDDEGRRTIPDDDDDLPAYKSSKRKSRRSKRPTSPAEFVGLLQKSQARKLLGVLRLLNAALSAVEEDWIQDFIQAKGLDALFDILSEKEDRKRKSGNDLAIQAECMKCLRKLMDNQDGLSSVVLHDKGTCKLTCVVASSNATVRTLALELLTCISLVLPDGATKVDDAVSYFQKTFGESMRFEKFVSSFDQDKNESDYLLSLIHI
eukprot:TRINITY_DN932_c0_g1_i4.p1 TRINITY_DN932_c0_g1~~TRINITY_DN932_c0_g1_i4.p1  ORF type:complete len:366 (+),score=106.41 TRINITY_DN932_c0_g1_i4:228-1325(+)